MNNYSLKRFLSLLLAMVMVFTMVPTPAHAEGEPDPTEDVQIQETEETTEETSEPTEESSEATEESTEATEESTEAPSEEATEESTEAPSEEATEESTEAPSEEATEESSEPSEEASEPSEEESSDPAEETEEEEAEPVEEDPSAPSEPEVDAAEAIQTRIDTIVNQYDITAEMTDMDIVNAIAKADGNTIKATVDEIAAINQDAQLLSMEELQILELDEYEHFCNVLDLLYFPLPVVTVSGTSGVEVTCDSNGSISESSGTVTATVKGSYTTRKTTTITVTNTSGSTALISFDYTVSNHDSSVSTIDNLAGADSGSWYATLSAGETKTFTMCSKRFTSSTTATATLKNFKVTIATTKYDLNLSYDTNYGSVSIDGVAATPGTHQVASATVKATVKNGGVFLGWITPSNGAVISTESSYSFTLTEAKGLKAVFAAASKEPIFWVEGKGYLMEGLTAALTKVSSASSKIISLAANGTLPAGNYTIPSGVTLLIPYNAANTLCTTAPTVQETNTTPSVYRTLTMAEGANITVNGAISVSASQSSQYGYNGQPFGPYGKIQMNTGSSITINNGAKLYCWGYIMGSGSVLAKSGSAVYECFQVEDYRGGDVTSNMASGNNTSTYNVFPLSQFYLQNVEVPMTMEAGATEYGHFAVSVTLAGDQKALIPFIGSEGLLNITSGKIIKDYDETTDRLVVDIYGELTTQSFDFNIKVGLIGTVNLDSANYVLGLNNNMTINVNSGTITIAQDIALQAETQLNIAEFATCKITDGKKIIVYDIENWGGYCGENNKTFYPLEYAPGRIKTRSSITQDASICVNGTLDATKGFLYSTKAGANIYSTGNGTIILTSGTETITYQAYTEGGGGTKLGAYVNIPITPAQLKNANGSYKETTGASNTTYTYLNGYWHVGTCSGGTATCTAKAKCSTCGAEYGSTKAHTEATREENRVDATCVEAGSYDLVTYCSVCNTVIKTEKKTLTATGNHSEPNDEGKCDVCGTVLHTHSYTVEKERVAATCTEDGYIVMECSCGETQRTTLSSNGHTPGADATCTTPQTCKTCGAELNPAKGHTYASAAVNFAENGTTYTVTVTCSACAEGIDGHTKTSETRNTTVTETTEGDCKTNSTTTYAASGAFEGISYNSTKTVEGEKGGHSYDNGTVTPPTCEADGYTTYSCSTCGNSYIDNNVDATGHVNTTTSESVTSEATCYQNGSKTVTVTCSCGYQVSSTTVTIPATNQHTYSTTLSYNDDQHYYACTTEGCISVKDAESHSYTTETERVEATCTTEGSLTMACSCGATQTTILEASGCNYSDKWSNDTTSHWHECSVCGDKADLDDHADTKTKDHNCDVCGKENITEHIDKNQDHKCDNGCSVAIGTCEDKDLDHDCDYGCDQVYGTCEDADFDHTCDYGCDQVYGTCEDKDLDHACDYGCDQSYGTCEDTDFDHDCDYGCDKAYGTCEDADKDHACDYGCDKAYGTCEDADKDHDCDYGCDKVYGTCEDKDLDHACDYGCGKYYGDHLDSGTDNDHICDYCKNQSEVLEECTPGKAVEENRKEADYNNAGSYDKVVYCSVCNTVLSRETITIPMLSGVASVNGTKYGTLAEAVNAAQSGETVVLLQNVTLETPVDATGKTVDLNGKILSGTVVGTLDMNGGTLVTAEGYKMIGPDAEYYHSTDAKMTLGADGSVSFHSGTVTLAKSWRTLTGQSLTIDEGATFVIPADMTFEVRGNATLKGNLINNGTLEILAGGSVNGTVYGQLQMSGGTYTTTEGRPMVGPDGAFLYHSSDALFDLGTENYDVTILSGIVTLAADWWTLAKQKLVIEEDAKFVVPQGLSLNVLSKVTVNGAVDIQGSVVLYTEDATIQADEGLNITTSVADRVVWYTEGKYVVHQHIAGAEATCTTAQTCTVCGDVLNKALGHADVAHDAKAPTCTEIGWDAYVTCTRCDYTTYEEKATLGHDEVSHDAKAPTCTEIGWDAYVTCSRCDYTTYEEKATLGHDEVSHEAKAPTCTEIGWDAYVTCSRCDYNTYVEKSALNHDEVSHEAKAPTCTEIGWDAYVTCSRCDYSTYEEKAALGHDEVSHDAKAPTCTEIGWDAYVTCTRCDYTTYAEKAALNHTSGETVVENEVAATCTTDGSYDNVVYCTVCKVELSRNTVTIPATGHNAGAAATCTAAQTCTVCGAELKAALGHTEVTRKENRQEATCGMDGSYDLVTYCSVCSAEIKTEHKTIEATGDHTSGAPVREDQDGNSYELVITCTVCGTELSRTSYTSKIETETFQEVPESIQDRYESVENLRAEMDTAAKETIENAGLNAEKAETVLYDVVMKYTDESGNQQIADEHHFPENGNLTIKLPIPEGTTLENFTFFVAHMFTTDAFGQKVGDIEYPEVEEINEGSGFIQFTVTGLSPVTVTYLCTDHSYENACDASCNVCGETREIQHSYNDGIVTTEPTCTTEGVKTFTCGICGHSYTEAVETVAHTIVKVEAKAPTCTEGGYEAYECCSKCSYTTKGSEIPATGEHSYNKGDYGVCRCGKIQTKLAAIEVSLDAETLMWLKFFIPSELINDDNAYVLLHKDGPSWNIQDHKISMSDLRAKGTDGGGRYIIEQGVASAEMTMDVTVQFVDGKGAYVDILDYADGTVDSVVSRTVLDYAALALEKGREDQKKVISALLVYGGYAQPYFNVAEDNLAYDMLPEFGFEIPTLEDITADKITQVLETSGANIGIRQTTQQAFLEAAIYHRVYFVLDSGAKIDNYAFTLKYVDAYNSEHTKTVEAVYEADKNRYYVDIPDIASPHMDYMYTITVTNKTTQETYMVRTSIMAWVKLCLEKSTNEEQKDLARAMYYYNQAANVFFGM